MASWPHSSEEEYVGRAKSGFEIQRCKSVFKSVGIKDHSLFYSQWCDKVETHVEGEQVRAWTSTLTLKE